jgi:hypothetical protein
MIRLPIFKKVGERLYRNPSTRSYYAPLKIRGKQIKQGLKTDDLPEARRKLRSFRQDISKVDPLVGWMTVRVFCDRQLKTIQQQAPKTVQRKVLTASLGMNPFRFGLIYEGLG